MSETKSRFPIVGFQEALDTTTALTKTSNGLELREVQHVPIHDLKMNPLSKEFFDEVPVGDLERLANDIRERGILVPLIAKLENKILLAGHNRLAMALEIGLTHVPVQYCVTPLDEKAERAFIVKDNLLRRQLTDSEKIKLYRILYENFDERLALRKPGKPNVNIVHDTGIMPLTAAEIARDTGQEVATVQRQLQRGDARNRASQKAAALESVERTPQQVVARQSEYHKLMKAYTKEIMQRTENYIDVLDNTARHRVAEGLRKLADTIENIRELDR